MNTLCGIDRIDEFSHILGGKRLGLMTGGSGLGRNFRASIEILNDAYKLTTLFAPEHGVRGEQQGGVKIHNQKDTHTGIPIYSLFDDFDTTVSTPSMALFMPSEEALNRIDALVVDIQDVGSRYYTYPSTMFFIMKACAAAGKQCIVLDRPNPIGGDIEGNTHREENLSLIGLTRVPIRHGMTMGELARFYNGEYHLNCDLHVIPLANWNRGMYYDETGLPRVCPSPNLPTLDGIVLYNATCMFAGTNITDGRGTTRPFEYLGAPYMNPFEVKDAFDALELPGVAFSVAHFIPTFFKYSGEVCPAVQIHVLDKRAVKPVALGVRMMRALQALYPDQFAFTVPKPGARWHIDIESGTDEIRATQKSADEILTGWEEEAQAFYAKRERYGLYE